jgi:hypothetical protein
VSRGCIYGEIRALCFAVEANHVKSIFYLYIDNVIQSRIGTHKSTDKAAFFCTVIIQQCWATLYMEFRLRCAWALTYIANDSVAALTKSRLGNRIRPSFGAIQRF